MVLVTSEARGLRMRILSRLALGIVWVVTGCTQSSDEPRDRLSEIRSACAHLARVWCESSARCFEATFEVSYGDIPNCVERRTSLCEGTKFGAGSLTTPDEVDRCASASDLSNIADDSGACKKWLRYEVERRPPEACKVPGELASDASCLDDSQCADGACLRTKACGHCGVPIPELSPCLDDAGCEPEHACRGGLCTKYSLDCGPEAPCEPELACVGVHCEKRIEQGHACNPNEDSCAKWPIELACEEDSCEPVRIRHVAEVCGPNVLCDAGLVCAFDAGSNAQPHCVLAIQDRLFCSGAEQVLGAGPCQPPAICLDQHCIIPDTAACTVLPP